MKKLISNIFHEFTETIMDWIISITLSFYMILRKRRINKKQTRNSFTMKDFAKPKHINQKRSK